MVFRSYPQLIRKLFNAYRFGPPSSVTWTSAWPRVDHLVSRLPAPTEKTPSSDSLSLRLRASWRLTSLVRATRRLIMQKARHHGTRPALTACRRTVSGTISLPCDGCFSPFPHGTCALSVSGEYLALADGPAGFTRGSTCPALLRIMEGFARLRVPAFHRLRGDFPDASARSALATAPVLQPRRDRNRAGLGSSPVARHYWGNHILFSLPRGTKMFQFPRFASAESRGWQSVRLPGCPIRVPPDQRPLASPRGFSQLAAPFFAFPSHRHPPCALSCFRLPDGPQPTSRGAIRRIPWNLLLCELRIYSCSLLFHHVNDRAPGAVPGRVWRITDSNR